MKKLIKGNEYGMYMLGKRNTKHIKENYTLKGVSRMLYEQCKMYENILYNLLEDNAGQNMENGTENIKETR